MGLNPDLFILCKLTNFSFDSQFSYLQIWGNDICLIELVRGLNRRVYIKYLTQYLASGEYSLLFSGGSMAIEMLKRQLRNKGEFRRDIRCQPIFVESKHKTLIILSEDFWADEVTGENTGEATLTGNLGRNPAKDTEGIDRVR